MKYLLTLLVFFSFALINFLNSILKIFQILIFAYLTLPFSFFFRKNFDNFVFHFIVWIFLVISFFIYQLVGCAFYFRPVFLSNTHVLSPYNEVSISNIHILQYDLESIDFR